ncbi:flagellar FliJ family protein [Thalassotalea sp. PLHSN55]|uniref:flagellar FliJ family protein n=1 Tax=Thalassotalea sp. PLHSN55 TaxID=3435888 RepID=UPI003F86D8F7
MLSQYHTIEEQKLTELVRVRDELNAKLTQAQQQQQQLKHYQHQLISEANACGALGMANNLAMRAQISTMCETLEQQIILQQLELTNAGQQLQQQLAKVKGIERLKRKETLAQRWQQDVEEQAQLDDLAAQSHAYKSI